MNRVQEQDCAGGDQCVRGYVYAREAFGLVGGSGGLKVFGFYGMKNLW